MEIIKHGSQLNEKHNGMHSSQVYGACLKHREQSNTTEIDTMWPNTKLELSAALLLDNKW